MVCGSYYHWLDFFMHFFPRFGKGSVVNSYLKKGSVMHLKPIYWSLI